MISISNYKILIFAAEPTQQSLSSVLGDQTLYFCQSLEQAQTALAETEIQLGFLDLDFNNDTLKLIEAIKSKNQNLPVAAMSKMNNIENIKKAMNSGFNDFLTTPLEENEIERSFSLLSKLYDNTQIVLQAQLDRFQEAKLNDLEMMATGIAHEINNPLAIILGHAMRIKRLANERVIDVGGVVSHVKDIESTLVRINKIVTGLRAFNSDSLKENFIETNISEIIKNTEMFYLEQIQQKGIKYTYFPPKQDILIKCLNVQLSQALL
ncbi:MAG: hybrid sensor histidine kinase/response regulator, partial [Bdellovibrionales bacterium]|nr:hybrid sensor histidine kinase/response regulator [Bdellovibrionales bacterium]